MGANSDLSGHSFEQPTPEALLTLGGAPMRDGEKDSIGVSDLAGLFSDDLTLREICERAYRMRDNEIQPEDR